jgi:glycosyltransferase involved in cell wall biosynthesis
MPATPVSVVQLSTGHIGGAGLAARRLHEQLAVNGIVSEFYCIQRENYKSSHNEFSIQRKSSAKILSKIAIYLNEKLTSRTHFSVFSTNATSLNFFRKLSLQKKRVLHFHNWQNLISQRNLIKLIKDGYPIVITIHDERITTGGCHYRLDCKKNLGGCQSCPRTSKLLNYRIKQNRLHFLRINLAEYPNFRIISPSEWLQNCAKTSLTIGSDQIINILNPLGPNWNPEKYSFSLKSQNAAKIKIGIATMSDSFVKYGDLLQELISDSEFQRDYEILYLRDFNDSENKLSNFWQEIDILLSLSRADNSPNSILEARSLQIPILSSNIGGIPELLGEFDVALDDKDHTVDLILKNISQLTMNLRQTQISEPIQHNKSTLSFEKIYELVLKNTN